MKQEKLIKILNVLVYEFLIKTKLDRKIDIYIYVCIYDHGLGGGGRKRSICLQDIFPNFYNTNRVMYGGGRERLGGGDVYMGGLYIAKYFPIFHIITVTNFFTSFDFERFFLTVNHENIAIHFIKTRLH